MLKYRPLNFNGQLFYFMCSATLQLGISHRSKATATSRLTRREWFRTSGALALSGVLITACSPQQTATLASMLDTLLPQDEFAGALALGYNQRLQQQIDSNAGRFGFLPKLADSLDLLSKTHHSTPFVKLNQDQREALLEQVFEQGSKQTIQNLNRLRSLIYGWYYGSKEGQQSLGYLAPAHYMVSR